MRRVRGRDDHPEDDPSSEPEPSVPSADDELDLTDVRRPPLPPEDRIWHHPSELRYLTAPPAPSPATVRAGRPSVPVLASVALAGGLVGALLTVVGGSLLATEPAGTTVVERQIEPAPAPVSAGGFDVAAIAAGVRPAVVQVRVPVDGGSEPAGSGVLFRDDGHLLTTAHVVGTGDAVWGVLADGTEATGRVLGRDDLTDLAVVKLDLTSTPAAMTGHSADLEVGAWAVVVGSRVGQGRGGTVTLGVISGLGREVRTGDGRVLYDLVQTDRPIAPGSSGGALVDERGAVVAIATAPAGDQTGGDGLGYGIPIDVALGVADGLMTDGRVDHAWLGMRGRAAEPTDGDDDASAVAVMEVVVDGPAHGAEIRPGDMVYAVDAEPVGSMGELIMELRRHEPGDTVDLTVERDGEERVVGVVLGVRPGS